MRAWSRANGGPPAVIILGVFLAGFKTNAGWLLVLAGIGYWVVQAVRSGRHRTVADSGQVGDLYLEILRESWISISQSFLREMEVRVSNRGSSELSIASFALRVRNGSLVDPADWRAVATEKERRKNALPRIVSPIHPNEASVGWLHFEVARPATGGFPGYTISIKDDAGNRYSASVPERSPRHFGS